MRSLRLGSSGTPAEVILVVQDIEWLGGRRYKHGIARFIVHGSSEVEATSH